MTHFVCMVSAGYRCIQSSNVVSSKLSDDIPLSLSDITLNNVNNNFNLDIKIFAMKTSNTDRKSSTSSKRFTEKTIRKNLKRLFSAGGSGGAGGKSGDGLGGGGGVGGASASSGSAPVFRKSNFKLIASAKLSLSSLGHGTVQHELRNVDPHTPSPLRGHIRFRVAVQPEYTAHACGFLTFMEDVGGYPAWEKRWCIMDRNRIHFWKQVGLTQNKSYYGENWRNWKFFMLRKCL